MSSDTAAHPPPRSGTKVSIRVVNPKRHSDSVAAKEQRLFPYYAGYSSAFAENCIATLGLAPDATILDPWNGSGTTTRAASVLGYSSIGLDLNPVMVLAAKAACVSYMDASSLLPLAHSIVQSARKGLSDAVPNEPLEDWFCKLTATAARSIEREINRSLVSHASYRPLIDVETVNEASSIAALLYLALFRIMRRIARGFSGSNPTWIRRPKNKARASVKPVELGSYFVAEVATLMARIPEGRPRSLDEHIGPVIKVANAESIPIADGSIQGVVGSPPYCTRIDYAVTTSVELATLGYDQTAFSQLRRNLTGTSTVDRSAVPVNERWGATCLTFLDQVRKHESYASATYYYKSHASYYDSIFRSIEEIGRVLDCDAPCVLVVQNSYYKEHLNDVAQIITEMGDAVSLQLIGRTDFESKKSMVRVNAAAQKYKQARSSVESVLCFKKVRRSVGNQ